MRPTRSGGSSGVGGRRSAALRYQYQQPRHSPHHEGEGLLQMDRSIICCVRLQTLLYFGYWYDILYAFIHLMAVWYKWRWVTKWEAWGAIAGNLFLCFGVEPFRIFLGYSGNLGEGVASMLLFVAVSALCLAFLLGEVVALVHVPELQGSHCSSIEGKPCFLPIERAAWCFRATLYVFELIFGIRALVRLIREQSARFFMSLEAADRTFQQEASIGLLASQAGDPLNSGIELSRAMHPGRGTPGLSWAAGVSSASNLSSAGSSPAPSMMGRPLSSTSYTPLREHVD
eukprot:CAMPEP_0206526018 /NCGR_PEP_ID=MMETSP0325_2-20121206/438_1 /ASSEMBLY_ACC=CAM_ASM_000347 /TAXON_ID=2866 /ORGANISM="Crypthecodinium cohnii, Strain Seligo" /LENGTH=285 /DNA_ID=CAMNT_0054021027 /DNA_START=35 /DNA_END=892 /DNA_ORIENTATION=+